MSRYYCKNCGSESIEGLTQKGDKALVLCNFCKKTNRHTTSPVKMVSIPDYETPEQYEKRTGKKWNGAVWFNIWEVHKDNTLESIFKITDKTRWQASTLPNVERMVRDFENMKYKKLDHIGALLCAQSPEPPPDDWRPEEGTS